MHTEQTSIIEDKNVKLARRLINEYQYFLPELANIRISIRLFDCLGRGGVDFEMSHHIKTPLTPSKYVPSRPWGDTEAYALKLAVSAITSHYEEAVNADHSPSEDWLIPNPRFSSN